MSDPNQAYGNGFESDNSGWGDGNGYKSSSGYGYDNDLAQQQSYWGAGDTAYNTTDWITNPYVENPYETTFFDNAYSETFSNPNPTHDYSNYKSNSSGFELE